MSKNYFIKNITKPTFLLFFIYIQINCDLIQNNKHNETFSEYYTIFNKEIDKKFSIVTKKINTTQYNVILKMKYYEIKKKYEAMSKTISLLGKLISENNWNKENENKFDKEIGNFENNSREFNLLYNGFNKSFFRFQNTYKEIKKFLKTFFIILFIVIFIVLVSTIIISYFVIRRQRKYYQLKEEVIFNVSPEKNSEAARIKEKRNIKSGESIKIMSQKENYGPSSRNEIEGKRGKISDELRSEDKEKYSFDV